MPRVRIFLLTYRRPELLRRALASLLKQTCTDWVCELHNDAPEDAAPQQILAELAPGDQRFTYCAHETNWGPVATFNHAFKGGPEPYASLLEDDNWWEPGFLDAALHALEVRPEAALAWCNMMLWQEQSDRAWKNTGQTIWRTTEASPAVVEFVWPEILQAFGALHSNGAMLFRPGLFRADIPTSLPFAIIEHARERAARGTLLLLTTPLANFACTLNTARDADPTRWIQSKLLLAASFFQNVPVPGAALGAIWATMRNQVPRDTDIFFYTALALRRPRLLAPATASDWTHFLLRVVRRPQRLWRSLRFRQEFPDVWTWLVAMTAGPEPARATVTTKLI